ncbi:surfeit locus protein 1 [Tripterygium wilfordii]|uniref:surfeit locus protein 1 n=1 Tax=Tripterygium wilfordii TaxID=458696 RepID=UPI0018F8415D|nr:surfeit locus protein 1 [Tripterygium wilfordii]
MAAASISKSLTRLCRGGGVNGALSYLQNVWIQSSAFSTSAPSLSSAVSDSKSISSSQTQEKEKRSIWSKMFLFLPGAITFGLGTWQIFRRQDKIDTLKFRQKRLELEPLKFNDLPPSSNKMETLEFRRVACRGVFDEERTIFLGPRSRSISGVTENGYYAITPLLPIPNDSESIKAPILVNRGWVPRSWRDKSFEISRDRKIKSSPPLQQDERSSWWRFWSKKPRKVEDQIPNVTAVEVIGVVRGSEKPSMFVPENDPSGSQWFYVDVPAIARACGLPERTVYVEDINENVDPSNPYPLPKEANALIHSSVMPQDHLNYMLTWYSLSAAVTFMAVKRLRPKRNRR